MKNAVSVGLLLLRGVVGLAFIHHGWPKFQHAFSWMGPDSGVPSFLQALAALSEFGGGFALILGLLTRLAAFGLTCTMAYAVFMVHIPKGDPFVSMGGHSYELAAVYLVIMVVLLSQGAGYFAVDSLLFKPKNKS